MGVASGAKGFTALTVMRLVEDGVLALDTRARELLGDDLPLVDDAVTIEQLLAHRSGIGDYLDESEELDLDAYLMPVPVHQLDTAESYLAVLDGFPQAFEPGTDFAYCNGGYVVLALLAERAAGVPFHDLVQRHVIDRAGLTRTAYLRSDALPGDAALGYLHPEGHADELRTNVLHLPVVGGGDGGIFTTAADLVTLWQALDDGRVVAPRTWAEMRRVRSTDEDARLRPRLLARRRLPPTSPARTPGRRSCPSTCPARSPGRCSATPPRAPGRWCGVSTSCCPCVGTSVLLTRGSVLDVARREVHSPRMRIRVSLIAALVALLALLLASCGGDDSDTAATPRRATSRPPRRAKVSARATSPTCWRRSATRARSRCRPTRRTRRSPR